MSVSFLYIFLMYSCFFFLFFDSMEDLLIVMELSNKINKKKKKMSRTHVFVCWETTKTLYIKLIGLLFIQAI